MIRIHDALEDIIYGNQELSFGYHHGLFNLTQLARFLKPLVAARVKRSVSEKALLMALSRMQRSRPSSQPALQSELAVERVSLHSSLHVMTFYKNRDNHSAVGALYRRVQKADGYMTVSEGTSEITIIVESAFQDLIRELFKEKPIAERKGVVSVGVRFHKKYLEVPGYIYKILQVLALQSVNILELSSTATELVIYIDQKNTQVAMDTIVSAFRPSRR